MEQFSFHSADCFVFPLIRSSGNKFYQLAYLKIAFPEGSFLWSQNSRLADIFSQHVKIFFFHLSWEIIYLSYPYFEGNIFSGYCKKYLFIFAFTGYGSAYFFQLGIHRISSVCSMIPFIGSGKFSAIITSRITFTPFFTLLLRVLLYVY